MGNCQAIDNASLVVQHPCGRVDRLYWPVVAGEMMKMNPGHYVALLLTTTLYPPTTTITNIPAAATNSSVKDRNRNNSVRITRIKLLRPTDSLVLGHAYRLIPSQEVMKGLWAKRYAKMKKQQSESADQKKGSAVSEFDIAAAGSELERSKQVRKHERQRKRTPSPASSATGTGTAKSRAWHPSLKSISEAGS
ncbi:hypothetical protein RJ639_034638 [Escallonia herrerae]|uniref:Uncharacterized protein n=1 Tax=Escallonia herrerae TaxID=1293975 RepID=A0AA89BGM5_9ASTE|nr:hypothetical protein RJ639_034638 [Escallonia herrerae]